MERVKSYTDYCVYIDVADSFFVVIIKLRDTSVSLRYLSKQSHLAMAILEDKWRCIIDLCSSLKFTL